MIIVMEPEIYEIGDSVTLKKAHPCGSVDWVVVRLGADIGLECRGCGRRVLLTRRELGRRTKKLVRKSDQPQSADAAGDR